MLSVPPSIGASSAFSSPRRIIIGLNALEVLPRELANLNANWPLIVTDRSMVGLGYVDRIVRELEGLRVEVFSEVRDEPSLDNFEELAFEVRKGKCDAIIGLGGGSVLDSAKIASFSATNPGPVSDYIGADKVQKRGLPLICMPTTSGTGSEVTRFAVIRYERTKRAVSSDLIIPDVALVDPALTTSMPPKLTAYTGLDALAHAAEAMISTRATPFTDMLALGAIGWIFQYLKRAYDNGGDLEARYYMSAAATTAGLSFNGPGVILAHSIGQTIGPVHNIPHGLSVALALPYMLDFYLAISAAKIALMGKAAGVYDIGETDEENARDAIARLRQLYEGLHIPLSLREVGVPLNELESLAKDTVTLQSRRNSPIEFTSENILQIYSRMWKGQVLG